MLLSWMGGVSSLADGWLAPFKIGEAQATMRITPPKALFESFIFMFL